MCLTSSAAVVGCSGSTSCGIGHQMCSTDWKQAQKCVGPDEGGDADGEIKVLEDCAATGKVCSEDINTMTDPSTVEAGCVPSACAATWPCFHPAEARCDIGYQYLMICGMNGDCPTWKTSQDCEKIGMKCSAVTGGAACAP